MSARESILVTGGAGFVGSHFARAAHEAGSKVIVLDDLSAGTRPALPCTARRRRYRRPRARRPAPARARHHRGRSLRRQDPGRRERRRAAALLREQPRQVARARSMPCSRPAARSCSRRRRRSTACPSRFRLPRPRGARRSIRTAHQARDRGGAARVRRRVWPALGARCATSTPPVRIPTAPCARATSPRRT